MKAYLTILLWLFTTGLLGQQVSFSFDKQKILIGEPIKVTIQTTIKGGELPEFFAMDTLPHFEVMQHSKIDTVITEGMLQLTQTTTITSWDSGRWSLPSLINNKKSSKPVSIDVGYTTPFDPKQPYHDIKGIVPVKNEIRSSWWWYLIGLAIIVALFFLFFPAGKKETLVPRLDTQAYKKALQQLEKLQQEKIAFTNSKLYHTELVTIFRTYLKNGKGLQSFFKTTDDLGIQLQKMKLPVAEYNGLLQTLRLTDLVKFAEYKPDNILNDEALDTIKASITLIEQHHVV